MTLPSQVRYHEETGTLYVLDGIAQGLRRYSLRPLALELPVVN